MPSALAASIRQRLAATYLRVGELIEFTHADLSTLFVQGQWSVLTQVYRNQRFASAVYDTWIQPAYLVRAAGTVAAVVGDTLVIDGRMVNVQGVFHAEVDSEIVSTEIVCADVTSGSTTIPGLATHAALIATNTVLGHVRIGTSLSENLGTGMIDVPAATISRAGSVVLAHSDGLDTADGLAVQASDKRLKRALWLQLLPAEPSGTGNQLPPISLPYRPNASFGAAVLWVPKRLLWTVETVGSIDGVIQLKLNDGVALAFSSSLLSSNLTLTAGFKGATATAFSIPGGALGLAQLSRLAIDVITLPTDAADYAVWLMLEEA